MPESTIHSILFVCMGNICRSPAGENMMRQVLQQAGMAEQVLCDSGGIIDYHAGHPPDSRMRAAGQRRGLPMTGIARQVTRDDRNRFDLILAMDHGNHSALLQLSTINNRHKIRMFCSFCTEHPDHEVPDPYYGGAEGFEYVLDLMADGCSGILQEIRRRQ
jgi:protein-tyrosine phosphatase